LLYVISYAVLITKTQSSVLDVIVYMVMSEDCHSCHVVTANFISCLQSVCQTKSHCLTTYTTSCSVKTFVIQKLWSTWLDVPVI